MPIFALSTWFGGFSMKQKTTDNLNVRMSGTTKRRSTCRRNWDYFAYGEEKICASIKIKNLAITCCDLCFPGAHWNSQRGKERNYRKMETQRETFVRLPGLKTSLLNAKIFPFTPELEL